MASFFCLLLFRDDFEYGLWINDVIVDEFDRVSVISIAGITPDFAGFDVDDSLIWGWSDHVVIAVGVGDSDFVKFVISEHENHPFLNYAKLIIARFVCGQKRVFC